MHFIIDILIKLFELHLIRIFVGVHNLKKRRKTTKMFTFILIIDRVKLPAMFIKFNIKIYFTILLYQNVNKQRLHTITLAISFETNVKLFHLNSNQRNRSHKSSFIYIYQTVSGIPLNPIKTHTQPYFYWFDVKTDKYSTKNRALCARPFNRKSQTHLTHSIVGVEPDVYVLMHTQKKHISSVYAYKHNHVSHTLYINWLLDREMHVYAHGTLVATSNVILIVVCNCGWYECSVITTDSIEAGVCWEIFE